MLWIMGQTKTVDVDSAGRISLAKISEADRERLNLGKSVMVVGNRDHFEIWSADEWKKTMSDHSIDEFQSFMFRK